MSNTPNGLTPTESISPSIVSRSGTEPSSRLRWGLGGDSFFESMRKSEGAGGLLRGPWRHRGHSCLAFEETNELETATDRPESEAGSVKQPFEATRDLPREFRRDLWSAMVGPILDHHYFYPVFSIY